MLTFRTLIERPPSWNPWGHSFFLWLIIASALAALIQILDGSRSQVHPGLEVVC